MTAFFGGSHQSIGQGTTNELVIENFVEAINNEGEVSKKLKKFVEKGSLSTISGRATIDTIIYQKDREYVAQLSYSGINSSRIFLKFIFGKRNQLREVTLTDPTFLYPKNERSIISDTMLARIDEVLYQQHLNDSVNRFNGCLMVIDREETVFSECYGYANFGEKLPLNDSTLFDIASCAKQFTALVVLLLEEQNKLSLSDLVTKYLPGFPYEAVTIEQLLAHTSGIPDYVGLFYKHWDKTKYATNSDILAMLKADQPKLHFEPGEQYKYTNTGYALLSLVIEEISGITYSEFLKENIFDPLGMTRTRVYNTRRSQQEILKNYAYGYLTRNNLENSYFKDKQLGVLPDSVNKYQFVKYLDTITGEGNISSNLKDLAIWNNALRENTLLRKRDLSTLPPKHRLNSGEAIDYGFGFFLIDKDGSEPIAYHTGAWPGYYAAMLRLVNQDKTVIVLSNNSYNNYLRLSDDIVSVILGENSSEIH